MIVLGIESSCDELAFAVLDSDGLTLRASVVHSQIDLHAQFGGVVPEVASRDHVIRLGPVLRSALEAAGLALTDIDGIAVTAGPGLIGPLLCGVEFAKGLALALDRPLIGVNHLEGHIAAAFLDTGAASLAPPFVALLVSGGHTSLIRVEALGGPYSHLGATRDDAAGEAFDKTAKLLGLGYPGGVAIDHIAADGDPKAVAFPKMMPGKDNLDFSFSGLKTDAARRIREMGGPPEGEALADFCASFREAIVDNLLKKAFRAVEKCDVSQLVLAGGVAANSRLREKAVERGRRSGVEVFLPSRAFCTDNAAMIAKAGHVRLSRGESNGLDLAARAHWPLVDIPKRKRR
ncbi:MAG: tRNA (adenosine(37)-N6)-threonylcarbamoyltransferase complex transferase subunit TsaD [Deltaproteobacteria bacterium]